MPAFLIPIFLLPLPPLVDQPFHLSPPSTRLPKLSLPLARNYRSIGRSIGRLVEFVGWSVGRYVKITLSCSGAFVMHMRRSQSQAV